MILGQQAMFAPTMDLPLRKRVSIQIAELKDVRFMLQRFHYLHRVRTGRQINYAVLVDGVVDGVITYAHPMMSASLLGVPSDQVLEFARLYLHRNVPHSASCAIGKSLRVIHGDWMRLYPQSKEPKIVVSWSDTVHHKGTIYKAANFTWLKRTKGQPPGNKVGSRRLPASGIRHEDYKHDKDCWIYWLVPESERPQPNPYPLT